MDQVMAALKPAMESRGCNVTHSSASQIECKRKRGVSERTGAGGEKVTATLEAQGDQTHVRIWTGKKFKEKAAAKGNWSTPICQELIKSLGKPAPAATAAAAI